MFCLTQRLLVCRPNPSPAPHKRMRHLKQLDQIIVSPQRTIYETLELLDQAGLGILLLCDGDKKLVGLLTDGDIRRALLKQIPLSEPCSTVATRDPLVAIAPIQMSEALHLMDYGRSFTVNHLPVVDDHHRVVDLLLRRDLVNEEMLGVTAVIMAGGFGTRLRPLTEDLPKPMLPVGERPLLELILTQLRKSGIRHVSITTHYKPEKITEHFGDGKEFGVDLNYVSEKEPLGTAGSLGLMLPPQEPILVMNGDILTQIDFQAMFTFHRKHQADLTVGVRQYDFQVPYGVMDSDGPYVRRIVEKPKYNFLVNAGIYLLEPVVYQYIPAGQRFDMTDLITKLLENGRKVANFPIVEYWLDIGQHEDYEQAQTDERNGRFSS